jgi:hypothetical protein
MKINIKLIQITLKIEHKFITRLMRLFLALPSLVRLLRCLYLSPTATFQPVHKKYNFVLSSGKALGGGLEQVSYLSLLDMRSNTILIQ